MKLGDSETLPDTNNVVTKFQTDNKEITKIRD